MTTTTQQTEREGDERVHVRVLFFGAAREIAQRDEVSLVLPAPASVSSAFEEVLSSFPELGRFGRSLLFAVNEEHARAEAQVRSGDELAIFPPVSGGAGKVGEETEKRVEAEKDFFELTTEPIDVGAVARRVVLPGCGATVTLDGYVREWTRGRRTLYLVYEAYQSMALREMRRLGREAHVQFEIAHIGIVHRTGRLEIGDTSVVVAVSAPHRRAAFDACDWGIRELKRTVPIWKKEFYEDGEVWVQGESEG